jgi:hypothetical protein
LQLTYGFEVGRKNRRKFQLKLGAAAKMLWRRGGYRLLPTSAMLNPSAEQLTSRIGNFGKGYGFDLGSLAVFELRKNLKLQGALVATDIGDTSFGDGPQPVGMNLAAGMALRYFLKKAGSLSLLYELRHLTQSASIRRKQHLGAELALPVLKLYAGYNQAFLTYGAAVDIFLFRLTAASTTEELGSQVYQNPQTRWLLRLDWKLAL